MLTTKTAQCSLTGSIEGESKYTKLIKFLEVLDEIQWQTDSDICCGDDPIRTLGKFFSMTPGTAQQCIHAFRSVLSLEPQQKKSK
jgi:hypothetical protein